MARVFVDRIEGEVAVLLVDDEEKRVPLASLPEGAREGSWLTDDLGRVDPEAGARTAAENARTRARLVDDDGGDFSL